MRSPAVKVTRRRCCKRRRRAPRSRRKARHCPALFARKALREARRAASGFGRALLFGSAGPPRCDAAIEDVNAAGGIKALGGAKIEAMLGDAQSTPEGGNAEVEK